ncbi:hypothetical protein LCGC14_1404150, partial [marine sediment metagenome]
TVISYKTVDRKDEGSITNRDYNISSKAKLDTYHHLDNIEGMKEFPDGYWFDQCIINRYEPGQGIGAHRDRPDYGEFVACFTLGSGAEIEFSECHGPGSYKLYTEPRSLYIMSGASRHEYTHMIRGRKSDPGYGKRGRRWSLTFRSVET